MSVGAAHSTAAHVSSGILSDRLIRSAGGSNDQQSALISHVCGVLRSINRRAHRKQTLASPARSEAVWEVRRLRPEKPENPENPENPETVLQAAQGQGRAGRPQCGSRYFRHSGGYALKTIAAAV